METRNNFDFLRLLFSLFVIVSHSYDLRNMNESDWLYTHTSISFSYLGVRGFFVISGYLIFQSLMRSNGLIDFYWKRILRVFPALFVVLVVTLLILPLLYTNPVPYLSNKDVWLYLPRNLSLFNLQYEISGVFEQNPFPKVINGSLWTLRYEIFFYLLISSLFFLKKQIFKIKIILLLFCLLNYLLYFYFRDHSPTSIKLHFTDLAVYFFTGSIFAVFNFEQAKNRFLIFIISLVLCVLCIYFSLILYTKYILLPLLILSFGQASIYPLNRISSKVGDLSYGIYISAFFIQQLFLNFYPDLAAWKLTILTILVSSFYGYISWNLVEKRALKRKKKIPGVFLPKQ